jgi:outer membrane lipoprotein-sorting protein
MPPLLVSLLLALTLYLAGLTSHAQAEGTEEPSGPVTWYAQALARGDAGLNVTHFWSKGALMRAETVIAGHKIITLVNGPTYYAYDATTGSGLAIGREKGAMALDRDDHRPFGKEYERLVELGAELIETENQLGRETGIYRVTDDFGRRKLWVTLDDLRLPLRIEIYERASTRSTTTDYVNWQSGFAIEDSFFAPDPRVELEAMDYATYAKRSAVEGPVGPVPVLYGSLLSAKKP